MRHCARVVRLRPLLSVAIVGFGLPVFALGAISIGGNSRGLDRGAGPLKAGAQPGATLPRRELDTLAGQRVTARQLPVVRAGVKGFWVGPSVRHGTYAVYAPPQQRAFRPVAGQRVALTG